MLMNREARGRAGRRLVFAAGLLLVSLGSKAAAGKADVAPELPAETLSVAVLAPAQTERVYVADIAINHIQDGRIRVWDPRSGKLLGMISAGYVGNFTLSAKGDELYLATTYLSRGSRGERTDVLEVHDTSTLGFKYEIILPPKRAQALSYRGLVRATANGRFVLVQNATPATSISVVDLVQRKVVNEVQTPGCWGLLPAASHASRFAMLCGDGKVATVTLDESGQVSDRQATEKLFDADADAWFHHAEQVGDRYWFVSFKGMLTELDLGGPVAVVKSTRSLVNAQQQREGWRPGGYQLFSVDPAARYLVVGMHDKGTEGSHKRPAKQLWTFDLNAGQRVGTAPGHQTASLTLSRNGQRLQALDGETGAMRAWQWSGAGKLKPLATVKQAGETSLLLESYD